MFAENQKISLRQLQVLLLLDSFSTALLFLPAELAQINGKACWAAALICGSIFALISLSLAKTAERFSTGTVVDWCRGTLGYVLGTAVLAGLALKMLLDGLLELRIFSEIICRTMLPNTPVWILSLAVLLVAGMLALNGVECRGRSGEVLFLVVMLPLFLVLMAVAVSAEYGRTLPLSMPSFGGLGQSILMVSILFQGLTFLYFVFPHLQKRKQAISAICVSSLVSAVVLTAVVFLCLAVYGEGVLSEKLLPSLQMMERISFTEVFLTRQDLLLLWFWTASVCIFLSGMLFYGAFLGMRLFRHPSEKWRQWIWSCLLLLFGASLLPENLAEAYRLRLQISPWLNLLYLVVLPVLLLILGRRRNWE